MHTTCIQSIFIYINQDIIYQSILIKYIYNIIYYYLNYLKDIFLQKMNKRPDFALIDLDKVRKKKKRELTDLEKQEIEEAFKLFDTDNDEQLDYHELKA